VEERGRMPASRGRARVRAVHCRCCR
jgi:hypothetical protein